jgi:hypothetical protein
MGLGCVFHSGFCLAPRKLTQCPEAASTSACFLLCLVSQGGPGSSLAPGAQKAGSCLLATLLEGDAPLPSLCRVWSHGDTPFQPAHPKNSGSVFCEKYTTWSCNKYLLSVRGMPAPVQGIWQGPNQSVPLRKLCRRRGWEGGRRREGGGREGWGGGHHGPHVPVWQVLCTCVAGMMT